MLKDILKDKNASLLGLVTLALFVILVIETILKFYS